MNYGDIVTRLKIYSFIGFAILLLSGSCTGLVSVSMAMSESAYLIFLAFAVGVLGICSGLIVLTIARRLKRKPPHRLGAISFFLAALPLFVFSYDSIQMLLGTFEGDPFSLSDLMIWDNLTLDIFMDVILPVSLFLLSVFCVIAAIDHAVLCILHKRKKTDYTDRTFD